VVLGLFLPCPWRKNLFSLCKDCTLFFLSFLFWNWPTLKMRHSLVLNPLGKPASQPRRFLPQGRRPLFPRFYPFSLYSFSWSDPKSELYYSLQVSPLAQSLSRVSLELGSPPFYNPLLFFDQPLFYACSS